MIKYNLKILVRLNSKDASINEVKYMIEGNHGCKIWGRRTSDKKTKLSSLINLIHSDSDSVLS